MPITKKPVRTKAVDAAAPAGVDVDAIIERGGTVPSEAVKRGPAKTERKAVLLQLYPTILDQIAEEIAKSPVRMTRQTWIELAIVEKLKRDQS
jgi:hypothetical protein